LYAVHNPIQRKWLANNCILTNDFSWYIDWQITTYWH